jgi:hypothetical protein
VAIKLFTEQDMVAARNAIHGQGQDCVENEELLLSVMKQTTQRTRSLHALRNALKLSVYVEQ